MLQERADAAEARALELRHRLEAESEALKQQVEVLKKEYYTLEVQHREGRAAERAELASLREQLHGYVEVERELDAAIRDCADEGSPASVDEALLIGTTLASAPT